ncbi:phage tail protein [Enterobacter cloacae complex sp. 2022EL-00747]|uniref:phage tail-collar fiber domain-containing protein n=1 Tax=Enterobacter cloacae complex sp. 2022EL-00747 TaxID=2998100 RepID=UPI00226DE3AC|nr:phage tail protein [Enterobacter cloacae complex sp. 2022EL-00747]MCY0807450.1 phage tail protein [Enterobacter cloacae complex sp. 2022EL-00747]
MSQTAITLVFEQWKAQQATTGEPVLLDEFVFALVPGLDPTLPVERSETLPPAAQIVHRAAVARKGVVNENSVVHSAVLGADVGDFSFNWIGLMNKASGTLAMIVHAPEQQKLKTKDGQQGNVLTRSFLMEFTGAQTETAINTPAETWQIDFTARMAGMDERQRQENIDIYGAAAFFGDGWLVGKSGNQFFVTKGAGYLAGLRAGLTANQNITVTTKPVKVWLDVCWTGSLVSVWQVQSKVTVAANLADYIQNGVQHYVFALASIDANGNITDLRPKGSLDDQAASDALKKHEQSRNHPDATTSAKGFVQLSSATDSTSESLAATPKAVKTVNDELTKVKNSLGTVAGKDVVTSQTDTTAGRVLTVGYGGLGGTAPRTAVVASNSYDNIPIGLPSGFWTHAVDGGPYAHTLTLLQDGGGNRDDRHLIIPSSSAGKIAIRWDGGQTKSYQYFYTDRNKPTAGDVDAVSASQGGTFQKPVTFNQGLNSRGRIIWGDYSNPVGASGFNAMVNVHDSGGKLRWAFGPYINEWSIYAYNPDGSYKGNLFRIDYATFDASFGGKVTPANYSNFDARYLLLTGGTLNGNLTVKNTIQIGVVGSAVLNIGDNDSGLRNSKDGQVDLWANSKAVGYWSTTTFSFTGQIIPTNYSNFDGRYFTQTAANARFLQGWRLGAVATATNKNNDNIFAEAPNGAVVVSVQQKTNYTAVKYRYAQYNLNGTWYNAGVAS